MRTTWGRSLCIFIAVSMALLILALITGLIYRHREVTTGPCVLLGAEPSGVAMGNMVYAYYLDSVCL